MKPPIIHLKVRSIFAYLEQFNELKHFKIVSPYPTINTVGCVIQKTGNQFKIKIDDILSTGGPPVQYQREQYGLAKSFKLLSDNNEFTVPFGVSGFNMNFIGNDLSGTINHLTSIEDHGSAYYKAIIPAKDGRNQYINKIESIALKTENTEYAKGYSHVAIDDIDFGILAIRHKDSDYFIIDNYCSSTYLEFLDLVESIVFSIGLITGLLPLDELVIISADKKGSQDLTGYSFTKLEKSQMGLSIIDPLVVKNIKKQLSDRQYFPLRNFALMINFCKLDKRFLSILNLICESFESPFEVQAAILSVTLESIRNLISDDQLHKVKPIKSKKISKEIQQSFKTIIDSYSAEYFNDKDALYRKIEQVNQPNNTSSLIEVFRILKIQLWDDDIECIKSRNQLLHGNYQKDAKITIDSPIVHTVFKLHLLVTSALFKLVEYQGSVVNMEAYNRLVSDQDNFEPLIREI